MHAFLPLHLLAVVPTFAELLSPVPELELGLVLQLAAAGSTVGAVVALRARARWPEADVWRITTAWSLVGLVIGVAAVVVAALL